MMQQCGKAHLLMFFRCSLYTLSPRRHSLFARRRSCGGLHCVLLGPAPSLQRLLGFRLVRPFLGTMSRSDFSAAFMSGLCLRLPDRSDSISDATEISRFPFRKVS